MWYGILGLQGLDGLSLHKNTFVHEHILHSPGEHWQKTQKILLDLKFLGLVPKTRCLKKQKQNKKKERQNLKESVHLVNNIAERLGLDENKIKQGSGGSGFWKRFWSLSLSGNVSVTLRCRLLSSRWCLRNFKRRLTLGQVTLLTQSGYIRGTENLTVPLNCWCVLVFWALRD